MYIIINKKVKMNIQDQKEKFNDLMNVRDNYFKEEFAALIDKYINLHQAINEQKQLPLTLCLKHEQDEFVKICLEKGANVNFYNDENLHPLLQLFQRDLISYSTLNMLLDFDANPNIVNQEDNNLTPLHYAAQKNRSDLITLLIKHKADVNVLDNDGNNPMMALLNKFRIFRDNEINCILNFLDNSININQVNKNNDNALTLLLDNLSYEEDMDFIIIATRKIIAKAIDLTQKNNHGQTAFHIAVEIENKELMLLTYHDEIDLETIKIDTEDEEALEVFNSLVFKQKLEKELKNNRNKKIKL
jgi:ankyrin repeat protein